MATGAITSLGIGSGLDLQDILDQLKEVDETRITVKENKKIELQNKVDAYNTVNAKLFAIKSDALNLSLGSNFLSNSVSLTDENIISATTIGDGYEEASYDLEVTQKAQRNSWESTAVENKTDIMFDEAVSGIADHDTTAVTTQPETLTLDYGATGEEQQIDIDLASGLTLTQIVDEINSSANNDDGDGNQLVTASFVLDENETYYIRLSATSGEGSADSEINITAGFDWVAADTTVTIAQGDDTMYLSVPPGTTYEGIANLINDSDDNLGVTAAIIDNGNATNPYQLTLTADDTGEDAILAFTNLDDLTEVTGTGDLNAKFTVNGISYQRQSNSDINDVVTGVTFDIKNENTAGESTTLNVEVNLGSVKDDIISMVKGLNDLISYIRGTDTATENSDSETKTEDDESNNPLEASSSAKRIVYSLQSLFTTIIDVDSDYTSLTDLGLSISSGVISIDETALDEAIDADPDALKALFIGDSDEEIEGLADIINDALTNMVSNSGIASTEIDQAKIQITRIDEDIENESARLTRKYQTMAADFARLDTYISQLNSESSALTSMIDAFNNANE